MFAKGSEPLSIGSGIQSATFQRSGVASLSRTLWNDVLIKYWERGVHLRSQQCFTHKNISALIEIFQNIFLRKAKQIIQLNVLTKRCLQPKLRRNPLFPFIRAFSAFSSVFFLQINTSFPGHSTFPGSSWHLFIQSNGNTPPSLFPFLPYFASCQTSLTAAIHFCKRFFISVVVGYSSIIVVQVSALAKRPFLRTIQRLFKTCKNVFYYMASSIANNQTVPSR